MTRWAKRQLENALRKVMLDLEPDIAADAEALYHYQTVGLMCNHLRAERLAKKPSQAAAAGAEGGAV